LLSDSNPGPQADDRELATALEIARRIFYIIFDMTVVEKQQS
jgi:hypothetical protein